MNCEGYFLDEKGNILAQDSGKGYLIFPGGGIEEGESPEEGLLREAFEETGVVVDGKLKHLSVLHITWRPDWAKTDKQKERYKKYKGDEMHFFTGKIKRFDNPKKEDDIWQGEKLMPIKLALQLLEKMKPFPKDMEEYYGSQLKFLRSFLK